MYNGGSMQFENVKPNSTTALSHIYCNDFKDHVSIIITSDFCNSANLTKLNSSFKKPSESALLVSMFLFLYNWTAGFLTSWKSIHPSNLTFHFIHWHRYSSTHSKQVSQTTRQHQSKRQWHFLFSTFVCFRTFSPHLRHKFRHDFRSSGPTVIPLAIEQRRFSIPGHPEITSFRQKSGDTIIRK